ncbi:MAG: hypothetical protein WCP18_03710 [bacterium]
MANGKNQNLINNQYAGYTKTGEKVGDFFLGFFLFLFINVMFSLIASSISLLWLVFFLFDILILIWSWVYCKRVKRKFIAIGVTVLFLMPIIFFGILLGSCFGRLSMASVSSVIPK